MASTLYSHLKVQMYLVHFITVAFDTVLDFHSVQNLDK